MPNVNYTVRFPLTFEGTEEVGHDLIGSEDLLSLVVFNMKNVLLTNKTERMFDSEFGVGLNQYLFENIEDPSVVEEMVQNILDQLERYVPYVTVNDITTQTAPATSTLSVRISFTIEQISLSDVLDVAFDVINQNVSVDLLDDSLLDEQSSTRQRLKEYIPPYLHGIT